ncbi:arylsulfatase [Alienimonas sp. DA493]|uniref:arylsulfatase n=1 Tax=Alienimonas sp. DA493 TaxID=3373605 RepID=UPI0037543B12
MHRCRFSLAAVAVLFAAAAVPAGEGRAERPNLVVILVDDMGFSDVGCYGSEIATPHIDALAANGLRFTQFYNSGRCCPTRASLLTGLHPHQTGIGHMTAPPGQPLGIEGPYQGYLNDECVTIPEVLRPAGYRTLMTGKWHLGANRKECWPLQRGFDRFYGGLSGAFNYFEPGGDRGLTEGNEPVETGPDFYATDAFTDRAIEFLEETEQADGDKPFFLYLAYNAPHWPLNPKVEDFERYRGKYRDGWAGVRAGRLAKQKELGLFEGEFDPAPLVGPDWESLTPKQRDDLDARMAAYAGCIAAIDENVGSLVDHLERTGELENTLILFLSDNGACQEGGRLGSGTEQTIRHPPLRTTNGPRLGLAWANACNTPFRLYKHFVHEGGACTPLIAHWPAAIDADRRGGFVRELAYLPDVMATAVELANAEYPATAPPHAGASLVPLLTGEAGPVHDEPLFWEHEGNAAVRDGDWKLVREYGKPWELYDLATDRTEMHDRAAAEPDRTADLVARWEAWATETGVAFPERFNMYQFLNRRGR